MTLSTNGPLPRFLFVEAVACYRCIGSQKKEEVNECRAASMDDNIACNKRHQTLEQMQACKPVTGTCSVLISGMNGHCICNCSVRCL